MKLAVKTNIDDVFNQLDRALTSVSDVAVPRAINELRDQAQTAGNREIASIYKLPVRALDKYTTTTFATPRDLSATITVKGLGFPLTTFAPRQTRQGVSVAVKGKRFIIPHTFLARMPSGHVGVFARGAYGGKGAGAIEATGQFGRFTFGKRRLPINELYSFGPAEAFSNPDVTQAMQDRVEEQAARVLEREIRFAVRQ